MTNPTEYKAVDFPGLLKRKRGAKDRKLPGLPTQKTGDTFISYDEFCDQYRLHQGDDPGVSKTIDDYAKKYGLMDQNWAPMTKPFDFCENLFGKGSDLLRRLIYSNCDWKMRGYTYNDKVGRRIEVKGPKLRKISAKEKNRIQKKYITSLKTVLDYLQEKAPFLAPYPGDEKNPLSGMRQRELLWQLRALHRAELKINDLIDRDRGRKAQYAHDPIRNQYVRVGTAISDPLTVLLIYVWRAKEEQSGLSLAENDYQVLAELLNFWKFFPKEIEDDNFKQITLLSDRIRKYKKKTIVFYRSAWSQEYHPTVYVK